MKKMIKLSLVAAVAVAGLSTTASAGSLEEAIKGTSIKGQVTVGNETSAFKNAGVANVNQWEYDVDATFTTKVTDTITSTVGFQSDLDQSRTAGNSDAGVTNTKAYFTAKTSVATVMVGKQKVGTPFLDDNRGNGIVALVPAGPVTIAAAYFNGFNGSDAGGAFDTADVMALAALGKAGPVNFAAWYVDTSIATATNINVKGKFGPANVEVNHASAELDAAGSKAETLTKVIASMKMGEVTLTGAYAMTNDKSGATARTHGVALASDQDAAANFQGHVIELDGLDGASAFLIGASTKVAGASVGAHYVSASSDKTTGSNVDATELAANVSYALAKSLSVNAYYAIYDAENATTGVTANSSETETQINISYKF